MLAAIITWLLARLHNFCRSTLWSNIKALVPHTGVHTEHAGPGRVRFVSFFRGAGRVIRWRRGKGWNGRPPDTPGWDPSIELRGFTVYLRTAASKRPGRCHVSGAHAVRRFRITRNPNQPVV